MRFTLLTAALALIVAGCSDSKDSARIVAFSANPDSIAVGSSSTLSWETTGAVSLGLRDGDGKAISIGGDAEGRVVVRPSATTKYVLSATGEDGETVTAEKTVEVVRKTTIERFAASPDVVARGAKTTLFWIVRGAEYVVLTDDAGKEFDLEAGQTEVQVQPTRDTTYTLTAVGTTEVSADVKVTIAPTPSVKLTATPEATEAGEPVTLSWTSEAADALELRTPAGTVPLTLPAGTMIVNPVATTKYEAVATGAGGQVSSSVEVAVRPKIVAFEVETPGPTRKGLSVDLKWTVIGAASARIVADGANLLDVPAESVGEGTATLAVGTSGTFELVAKSAGGESRATATIALTDTPVITFFAATPEVTAGPVAPAQVEIQWGVDGATSVELEAIPGGPVAVVPGASIATVSIVTDTTFRLVARNDFGTTMKETSTHALPPPAIDFFVARPTRVGIGQDVELQWHGRAAERIEIHRDGALVFETSEVEASDPSSVQGTWSDTIAADTDYELRIYNRLGAVASSTLVVTTGAPMIGSFEADRALAQPGSMVEFTWTSDGGTALELLDPDDAVVCSTSDLDRIWSGSCLVQAGTTLGAVDFKLRVQDAGGGIDERTVSVQVTDGPIIQAFASAVAEASDHDPVVLTWTVLSDAAGLQPTVEIAGSGQNLQNPLTSLPASGTAAMIPVAEGMQRYTLTATTPGTTPATAFVDVTVYGLPTVSVSASPTVVDADEPQTTLTWTSTHAAGLWVFDTSMDPPEEVYSTTDPAEMASGSAVVEPTSTPSVTYLVVVSNPLGREASDTVTILVEPAEAVSVAAVPDQVLEGEETTISWQTRRATSASLSFDGRPGLPVAKPFIDASGVAGATKLTLNSGGGHGKWGEVAFPAGFTFPFAGTPRTGARVATSGFVTFDLASTNTSTTPAELPATAASFVHLAPFWGDLDGTTGEVWWTAIQEDGEDAVVIQWKGIAFFASAAQPSSLDFEVVLRGDGSFDYRYGSMISQGAAAYALGSQASIGFQGAGDGASFSFNAAVAGGLQGRTFGFPSFPLATTGSWTVEPAAGAAIGLHATNAHSFDDATASLGVWPAVKITSATLATPAPAPGQAFTIEWVTENATSVWIEDAGGVVRCTAAAQDLDEGSCSITEASFGDKVFTLHAEGGFSANGASRTIEVPVYTPFSIDTFAAGPALVEIGDDVTVSWTTTNAATLTLTGNGTPIDLTGRSKVADSLVLHPQVPTTYVLTLTTSEGRGGTATRKVQVRTAFANSMTATATQLLPGQSTQLSWNTAGTDQVTVTDGPLAPPLETTATKAFIDLEARATATEITSLVPTSPTSSERTGSLSLQLPFSFPYFGEFHDSVRVMVPGYLSFDPTHVTGYTASDFPLPSKKQAHLSPFMSQFTLSPSGSTGRVGKIFWEHIDTGVEDFVVIQWSHLQYSTGGAARNPCDISFQVILYRDGTFDYRYGPLTGPTVSTDGTFASIGYQDPTGTQGVFMSPYNTAFPGGLISRSFHFVPNAPATGTMTISPTESKTYRVCVTGAGGYVECKSQRIVVIQPGDVAITEVMPAPQAGLGSRWFEIRNLTADTLNLAGMEVESVGGMPFTVGALTMPPGGYATFADSSAVQGFTPSVITGTDVEISAAGGITLKLPYPPPEDPDALPVTPLTIASQTWNATYPFQPNQSLFLDPRFQYRGTLSNNDPTRWCLGDTPYDGVDQGSPGAHGGSCRSQHYVVDWHSTMPFIDIEETGLLLNQLTAHGGIGQMPGGLGFTMPFFGGTVSDLWASASGFVSFGPLATDFTTAKLLGSPGDPSDGLVAAQWESFELPSNLNAKFLFERRTVGAKQVTILQWTRFQRRLKPDNYTFQVQLWSDGDIVVANREMVALAGKGGATATVGIEAPFGAAELTYSRNQAILDPGQVLLFHKK